MKFEFSEIENMPLVLEKRPIITRHFFYFAKCDIKFIKEEKIMSITKAISNGLYGYLDKQGLEFEPERIKYSLDYICASITKIVSVLIVGMVSGTLPEVTTCMLAFGLLRQYSGGSHMGNAKICLFVMLCIYYATIGIAYLISFLSTTLYFAFLLSFIPVFLYSPADTAKHPVIGPKHRKRLRLKSFAVYFFGILLSIMFKGAAELIVISFTIQSITLTPIAYRLTNTKRKEENNVQENDK